MILKYMEKIGYKSIMLTALKEMFRKLKSKMVIMQNLQLKKKVLAISHKMMETSFKVRVPSWTLFFKKKKILKNK